MEKQEFFFDLVVSGITRATAEVILEAITTLAQSRGGVVAGGFSCSEAEEQEVDNFQMTLEV